MKALCIGGPLAGKVVDGDHPYLEAVIPERKPVSVLHEEPPRTSDSFRKGVYKRTVFAIKPPHRRYFYAYVWQDIKEADAEKIANDVLSWATGEMD